MEPGADFSSPGFFLPVPLFSGTLLFAIGHFARKLSLEINVLDDWHAICFFLGKNEIGLWIEKFRKRRAKRHAC